jgi:hypothetical protein
VPHTALDLGVEVFNEHGVNVFTTGRLGEPPAPAGLLRSSFFVSGDFMNSGTYRVNLTVFQDCALQIAYWEDLVVFEVHDTASELRGNYFDFWPGAVRPRLEWTTDLIQPLSHFTSKT